MIDVYFDEKQLQNVDLMLRSLSKDPLNSVIKRAAKRAASTAKTTGSRGVRSIYTIKNADIMKSSKIISTADGAILRIASPRLGAEHYKTKQTKKGVFVSVKKGSGGVIPRSFGWNKTFFQRKEGVPRLPIERIISPAVPQLFENDAVQEEMIRVAAQKYKERVIHEIGRIVG